MNIFFPDDPPVDPMDGDYLWFGATVDGRPIKCCVTFEALAPRSNNLETIRVAYLRKRELLKIAATVAIQAGKIRDGEIVITNLQESRLLRNSVNAESAGDPEAFPLIG